MKKNVFIMLFTLISILSLNEAKAQPPLGPIDIDPNVTTSNKNLQFTERDLITYPFCSCDCSQMIKSAKIFTNQTDDEVYLYGGYREPISVGAGRKPCQKIELTLSACNGVPINCVGLDFDDYPCLNHNDYKIYYEKSNGNLATTGIQFNAATGTSQLCLFDEPIPACSTRKVVFYICSEFIYDCSASQKKVHFNFGSPCNNVEMNFHFDVIVGVPKIDLDTKEKYYDLKLTAANEVHYLNYKIMDINSNTIESGRVSTIEEAEKIILSKPNNSFLIIKVFKNNEVVYEKKVWKD